MSVEITFEDEARNGLVAEGTYVWEAAKRLGVRLPADCKGRGECDTCAVVIVHGAELLSPLTDAERKILGSARLAQVERLACQAKLEKSGGVVVRRVPARARAEKDEELGELRKQFRELPTGRKVAALLEFEVVTMLEALNAAADIPFTMADKVLNLLARKGRSKQQRQRERTAPAEHHQKAGDTEKKD